jgi:hypothetical protein
LESEQCGLNTNGGCSFDPPQFQAANLNEVICGTLWAESGQRDIDWFEITINDYATLTMHMYANGPVVFGQAEQSHPECQGCGFLGGTISPSSVVETLEHGTVETGLLVPGTYYFVAQPNTFTGYPCETLRYQVEWIISTYTPTEGDYCTLPIPANLGLNSAPKQQVWYSFTGNGNQFRVSSCLASQNVNTDLYIFDVCCGSPIAYNDDSDKCGYNPTASTVDFYTDDGVEYLIFWDDTYTTEPFEFLLIDVTEGENVWMGNNSDDWNDDGNWSKGSPPDEGMSAYIPASPQGGLFPETNSGEDAACYSLTIESGAHLYIKAGNTLTVNGALKNQSGTEAIKIMAGPSGYGSLIHSSSGVEATVEQYLFSERWHYASPPVPGATANVYYGIYVKQYNEVTGTWTYITEPTDPLQMGKGYAIWADDSYTGPTTVSFTGDLQVADYTISGLTYTPSDADPGYHMIGNPYPCSIEWNSNWSDNNVDAAAYFYNGSQYVNWNRLTQTGTAGNGIIPPTQGFFVHVTSAGAEITIPQSERIHGDAPFYKETTYYDFYVNLLIEGNGFSDEIIIATKPNATAGFDNDLDAYDLRGIVEAPQLYSMANDVDYSVHIIPPVEDGRIIPLGLEVGAIETYTLLPVDFQNSYFYQVLLEDLKEDLIVDLENTSVYSFVAEPEDDPHRFNLHVFTQAVDVSKIQDQQPRIYSNNETIYVMDVDDPGAEITIYNITGQIVFNDRINGNRYSCRINHGARYYIVGVRSKDTFAVQKVFVH